MACETGYIQKPDGSCEYVGYMPGDSNLDGTPDTAKNNSWWDQVEQNLPGALILVGNWWQSKQQKDSLPANNGGTPPPPAAAPKKSNTFLYVGIGAAVLVAVVLLVRRRNSIPV